MCSDSTLYLNFVKASERFSNESFDKEKSRQDGAQAGTLSGHEAKEFYTSVLASTTSDISTCTHEIRGENTEKFGRFNLRSKTRARRHSQPNPVCTVASTTTTANAKPFEGSSIVDIKGANIRLVNKYLQAAQNGSLDEIVKLLNENRYFDVNICDQFGWTALMCASYSGHEGVVKYLLKKGALWKSVLNSKGQTALDLAKLAKHQTVVSLLQSWDPIATRRPKKRRCSGSGAVWCPVCQQEFTENLKKHQSSTVHQFNCQHKPKGVHYSIPGSNPGYQLMVKSGWDEEKGLGPEGEGRKYPIKTVLKRDRYGLGNSKAAKAKVTHFGPHDEGAIKRHKVTDKTERRESKKTLSKKQKQHKESKEKAWERNMRLYMNS